MATTHCSYCASAGAPQGLRNHLRYKHGVNRDGSRAELAPGELDFGTELRSGQVRKAERDRLAEAVAGILAAHADFEQVRAVVRTLPHVGPTVTVRLPSRDEQPVAEAPRFVMDPGNGTSTSARGPTFDYAQLDRRPAGVRFDYARER